MTTADNNPGVRVVLRRRMILVSLLLWVLAAGLIASGVWATTLLLPISGWFGIVVGVAALAGTVWLIALAVYFANDIRKPA